MSNPESNERRQNDERQADLLFLDKETVKDLEPTAEGPRGALIARPATETCVTCYCFTWLVCPIAR